MILSTASSQTIEDVAAASGDGPRWYQLYWPNDDDVCASILERAQAAGFTTLVVTLDTWTVSWRPKDLDTAYLPFLRGVGTAIPFSDPAFRAGLAAPPEEDLTAAVLKWVSTFTGEDKSWDRLPFLRQHWDGPIVLKGILHPTDAAKAVALGVEGIWVSNHGGRQIEALPPAIDVLPAIAAEVAGRATLILDSGIRSGTDVIRAVALGAQSTFAGKAFLWSLGALGGDGPQHVIDLLMAEAKAALGQIGAHSLSEARSVAVRHPGAFAFPS